jgi:hypothetical protein
MEQRISVSISEGVADVRLVRADKMNALDAAMFDALVATSDRPPRVDRQIVQQARYGRIWKSARRVLSTFEQQTSSFRGVARSETSPESITTIVSMDSGPAPRVGNCRPKAHPEMTA